MPRKYFIPLSSGIYAHRKAMGIAIWEFAWMIDHTTKEENGIGVVLGGRPVSYDEISSDFKIHRNTVKANINALVNAGYLIRKRTPRGFSFEVNKSKKFSPCDGQKPVHHVVPTDEQKPITLTNTLDEQKPVCHNGESDGQEPVDEQKPVNHSFLSGDGQELVCRDGQEPVYPIRQENNTTQDKKYFPPIIPPSSPFPADDAESNDRCIELFREAYGKHYTGGRPYRTSPLDWSELRDLKTALGITMAEVPEGWVRAVENYFASPRVNHHLHHLCASYETYLRAAVDRFNKPVETDIHRGIGAKPEGAKYAGISKKFNS